jgi:uncharacterized protein YbjT (DUF2867 family)
MYAIAGVSGNTGKVVAEALLQRGKKIRALLRDPNKAETWRKRGAEIAIARMEDPAALTRALTGCEGAYFILPPDLKTTDFMSRARAIIASQKQAIITSGVRHVVYLSSIAAQHASGTGPVKALHLAEEELQSVSSARFTFLRAAYFMENHLTNLNPMRDQGVLRCDRR